MRYTELPWLLFPLRLILALQRFDAHPAHFSLKWAKLDTLKWASGKYMRICMAQLEAEK